MTSKWFANVNNLIYARNVILDDAVYINDAASDGIINLKKQIAKKYPNLKLLRVYNYLDSAQQNATEALNMIKNLDQYIIKVIDYNDQIENEALLNISNSEYTDLKKGIYVDKTKYLTSPTAGITSTMLTAATSINLIPSFSLSNIATKNLSTINTRINSIEDYQNTSAKVVSNGVTSTIIRDNTSTNSVISKTGTDSILRGKTSHKGPLTESDVQRDLDRKKRTIDAIEQEQREQESQSVSIRQAEEARIDEINTQREIAESNEAKQQDMLYREQKEALSIQNSEPKLSTPVQTANNPAPVNNNTSVNNTGVASNVVNNTNANANVSASPAPQQAATPDTSTANTPITDSSVQNSTTDLFDTSGYEEISTEVSNVGAAKETGGIGIAPIAVGLGAAAAVGVGAKVYKDRKENNELDLNEDRITNDNKYWTTEDSNVINSEKDDYAEVVNNKYEATAISVDTDDDDINKDTWSMPESNIGGE